MSLRLNFCRSVPPEFLLSFVSLAKCELRDKRWLRLFHQLVQQKSVDKWGRAGDMSDFTVGGLGEDYKYCLPAKFSFLCWKNNDLLVSYHNSRTMMRYPLNFIAAEFCIWILYRVVKTRVAKITNLCRTYLKFICQFCSQPKRFFWKAIIPFVLIYCKSPEISLEVLKFNSFRNHLPILFVFLDA